MQNSALGVLFQPLNHRQEADATKLYGQDVRATFYTRSQMIRAFDHDRPTGHNTTPCYCPVWDWQGE